MSEKPLDLLSFATWDVNVRCLVDPRCMSMPMTDRCDRDIVSMRAYAVLSEHVLLVLISLTASRVSQLQSGLGGGVAIYCDSAVVFAAFHSTA